MANAEQSPDTKNSPISESFKSVSDSTPGTEYLLNQVRKKLFIDSESVKQVPSKIALLNFSKDLSYSILEFNSIRILEILCELVDFDITADLLSSTKLMKILNYFLKSYTKYKNSEVQPV